jgi:hypothetical protein
VAVPHKATGGHDSFKFTSFSVPISTIMDINSDKNGVPPAQIQAKPADDFCLPG